MNCSFCLALQFQPPRGSVSKYSQIPVDYSIDLVVQVVQMRQMDSLGQVETIDLIEQLDCDVGVAKEGHVALVVGHQNVVSHPTELY